MRKIPLLFLLFGSLLSASCAVVNVDYLADDSMGGRDNGTAGSLAAQQYLIALLSGFGAEGLNSAATGDGVYKQAFAGGTNILGLIPGTDLADEYVIVGAHYDHLSSCTAKVAGTTICNGATDNAAGVAAVLEIGLKLRDAGISPRRSVVLAFWDREEDGLLGSQHYVGNPLVPLSDTVAYINFDIQGANLLPSLRNISFAIAAETGGPALAGAVQSAIASQPLDTQLMSSIFGQYRSDYFNFINVGVPSVFFSDSTGPCYHTTGDDLSVVDFGKLYQQINIAHHLTEQLASGAVSPTFRQTLSVVYDDAVVLDRLLQMAMTDLGRFSPSDQATIQAAAATAASIVASGRHDLSSSEVNALLNIGLTLVNLLTRGECDGFLANS